MDINEELFEAYLNESFQILNRIDKRNETTDNKKIVKERSIRPFVHWKKEKLKN